MFYAAFELRCGVEARLQEYLEPHEHIPISQRTEWNVSKLHKTATTAFTDQVSRIEIFRKGDQSPLGVFYYTPVTKRLRQLAERFGEHLHAAKESLIK